MAGTCAGFKEPPIRDWELLWDIVDVINAVAKDRKAFLALSYRSPGCCSGRA